MADYPPQDSLVNEISQDSNAISRSMLESDIDSVNKLFMGSGYGDVGQFMKNIAATESNLGSDSLGDYSFSPFQIDDIRYKDIVQRASENPGSAAWKRAQMANQFLGERLGREDFDILNLNLQEEGHNPLIGATLARMGLANVPESVPQGLEGQAQYWKDHWNTEAGKGTPAKFMSQTKHHYPNLKDYSGEY
jgi:hypothetical protein